MDDRWTRTALGFVATIAILGVLVYLVGVENLRAQLALADPALVGLVIGATLGWLLAWGIALRTVLEVLGVEFSVPRSFLLLSGAMFSNNVTPFGQAGGEPITALLISEVGDTEYETGLASIASVDTLNVLPSITLALIGLGIHATEVALGRRLELIVIVFVLLGAAVPTLIWIGWRRRERLRRHAVAAVVPFVRWGSRVLPPVDPPTAEAIEDRIGGFFEAIDRLADDRRGLAVALGFSTLGWVCQMLGLWLAFRAVGSSIPLSIALFAVPAAAVAGVTPLPGGAGGIESALVVLLVAATGPAVGVEVVAAAVVIFRGAVYWTPVLIGGCVVGVVSGRLRGAIG